MQISCLFLTLWHEYRRKLCFYTEKNFLNVIQRAVVIAPADSPLESLECVLLEADHSTQKLTVTATNVELSLEQRLPCKTDRDDALLVNARLLAAMLERLDGDTVSLEHVFDGTTVTLRSGTASYTVSRLYTRWIPQTSAPLPGGYDPAPWTAVHGPKHGVCRRPGEAADHAVLRPSVLFRCRPAGRQQRRQLHGLRQKRCLLQRQPQSAAPGGLSPEAGPDVPGRG